MEMSPKIRPIAFSLAGGQLRDANASVVARRVRDTCVALQETLAPIIGHKGVEALYKRSLHLAGRAHPWLLSTSSELSVAELLMASLGEQSGADSAMGGATFLQSFYELLTSLLGASLTERLLRAVWIDFLDDKFPQDTP